MARLQAAVGSLNGEMQQEKVKLTAEGASSWNPEHVTLDDYRGIREGLMHIEYSGETFDVPVTHENMEKVSSVLVQAAAAAVKDTKGKIIPATLDGINNQVVGTFQKGLAEFKIK